MTDPLLETTEFDPATDDQESSDESKRDKPRQRYKLKDDTGFDEVPKKYRRFYRRWEVKGDTLAPNEVICPVCMVVIRSARDLRPGDRVYCMPCFSRLTIIVGESGRLEARVQY